MWNYANPSRPRARRAVDVPPAPIRHGKLRSRERERDNAILIAAVIVIAVFFAVMLLGVLIEAIAGRS